MIVLRANPELKLTFEKLIQTMKVPVRWNGLFVVVDNYMILQGEVRSLFFHFDSRKVVTNIIELSIKESDIRDTTENIYVRNVINMILYAFGKWGNIKGIKVEKNFAQLNQLFSGIMREINIEPDYTKEYFRFYKEKIRITYEDVIQAALEAKEKEPEPPAEKAQGLWHKLLWKKKLQYFEAEETTVSERRKNRIGNNFYLSGYLCPLCKQKLHMVVYPVGKEFRIETEEGGVLLARAYTCQECCIFYTPRPEKLLAEGDIYVMDFEDDRAAYEDYLELLGKKGDRVSNFNYNRFAEKHRSRNDGAVQEEDEEAAEREAMLDAGMRKGKLRKGFDFGTLPDFEFQRFAAKIEEGFYPDASVAKVEAEVLEQKKVRREKAARERRSVKDKGRKEQANRTGRNAAAEREFTAGNYEAEETNVEGTRGLENSRGAEKAGGAEQDSGKGAAVRSSQSEAGGQQSEESRQKSEESRQQSEAGRQQAAIDAEEKYRIRISRFERLSERQRRELLKRIEQDKDLGEAARLQLTGEMKRRQQEENLVQIRQKAAACEGKSYAVIQKVYEETENADLPAEEKKRLLLRLDGIRKEQGEKEVQKLAEQMPETQDRKGYQAYLQKIRSYEGVDTASYEEKLKAGKEAAEKQEIALLVKRARKISRGDFVDLLERLRGQDFSPELLAPYEEKITEKISEIDREEIDRLCGNAAELDFEEAQNVYETIENGPFLPELKANALKMLEKRLAKIKTDECELLVQKLKNAMEEKGLSDLPKHYFYPARKVLLNQAESSETEVIDFAVASYGAGIGKFEYPILVVDTSRNGNGDKGILLTPEKLYYSNLMTSYHISVFQIESIQAQTGILNRGLYVHQKNGSRVKLPYTAETKQLPQMAEILDDFIKYLQEKPFSRKETYLAKEQHDTICCFRCGYVYRGGSVCPKCGYKMNE